MKQLELFTDLPKQPLREEVDWERCARFLWDLLDDIDSLDDGCRSDDKAFRRIARTTLRRRFEISDSDGYTVTFTSPPEFVIRR